jgi:hypothetical protein
MGVRRALRSSYVEIAHRREGWPDPRLVVTIVHNNDLNDVTG